MHERGGSGSIGWRYDWSEHESRTNLLRTHTTAVSSRMLYQLAEEYKKTGVFTPKVCEGQRNATQRKATQAHNNTNTQHNIWCLIPPQQQKYFSIDRVFRNESLDATHLAEFHQIEGLVADVGMTLVSATCVRGLMLFVVLLQFAFFVRQG